MPDPAVDLLLTGERLREGGVNSLAIADSRRFVHRRADERVPEGDRRAVAPNKPRLLGGIEGLRGQAELLSGPQYVRDLAGVVGRRDQQRELSSRWEILDSPEEDRL